MAKLEMFDISSANKGQVDISDAIVSSEVKEYLLHEVVKMQLAKRRAGTHSTKTRSEVHGSDAKPWKQKGLGRARSGSKTSPLWRGGGIMFGPKPRDYSYSVPKKKIKIALKSALSSKFADGVIKALDVLKVSEGKTKEAVGILKAFGLDSKVLIIHNEKNELVSRAFRNIPYVKMLHVDGLNVYDIINSRAILVTKDSLSKIEEVLA